MSYDIFINKLLGSFQKNIINRKGRKYFKWMKKVNKDETKNMNLPKSC